MLTDRRIRDAKPGPKPIILWDSHVAGLGVRITPRGVKSFVLNYRADGRERRATLARVGVMTLKAARSRAALSWPASVLVRRGRWSATVKRATRRR